MIFSLDFTRERIYAVHTPMPKFPVHPESPQSKLHLSKCLIVIIKMMDDLTSLPPGAFITFTFPEWYHIIDILVTLSRLCFPIPSILSWDPASTRRIAGYLPLVMGLQGKMGDVVRLLALRSSPFGGDVREKGKGNINIPFLFSAFLTILLEQYTDRVNSFVDAPFTLFDPPPPTQDPHVAQTSQYQTHSYATPPNSQHNGALRNSIYPMKSGLCPVMNGALEGTEYWDAMGVFKTRIGGSGGIDGPGRGGIDGSGRGEIDGIGAFAGTGSDAWMGNPIGGEIFDGNVIEDWGLWDLQAGRWEGMGYGG